MEPINRLKTINDLKASKDLEAGRHNEVQLAHLKTQETILEVFKSFADYLDKRVSKTQVVNQLKSINTPDSLKVVTAVDELHQTLKSHENTDLSEVTEVMQQLLAEAKQIPKALPTIPEQKLVDYSKQFESLTTAIKSVEEVVKAQKLVAEAPVVNVPEANVHVAAPDLMPLQASIKDVVRAVSAIVIPEYKTDNKAVEQLVKKSNDLLAKLLDKPVSRGGGGGGGSSWVATNPAGTPMPLSLNADGELLVAAEIVVPPIDVTNDGTFATPDKQDTGNNSLSSIDTKLSSQATAANQTTGITKLTSIDGKDFATQTTLALIKAKTDNIDVALSTRAVTGLTDTQLRATPVPVSGTVTANLGTISGAATAANQLIGLVPKVYDALTYTATSSTIDTYAYFQGGTGGSLVATLTVTFTAADHLTIVSVVRT